MDKRIGAQLYSLRTFLEKPEDLDPTFAKVADIGYKTIQVSGLGPMPYSLIKEKADQHGLEIVCTHMGMDRYIHEIDGVIADHKAMDCKIAGIGAMPGEYREDLDALKKSINHFNKFSEELGKEGITFGYHNHGFEFVKLDGKQSAPVGRGIVQPCCRKHRHQFHCRYILVCVCRNRPGGVY